MRGQLSVEMMIVLVVILGLAVLVASTMISSANKASQKIEAKTDTVLNSSDLAKGGPGAYCTADADCSSGNCNTYTSKCV